MTGEGEPVFTGYPPDFFDFIVVDECHRGGAKDESTWRKILEHFEPAAQLGLTATPKRRHNADTYAYFGEPVYTYALRDGIEDGFLTPFKVRQMASTIDEYVYVRTTMSSRARSRRANASPRKISTRRSSSASAN